MGLIFDAVKRQQLRLLDQRTEAIERAVGSLGEGRLFIPVAPHTNSVGNLIVHLTGNLRELVGQVAGDIPFSRDREAEFSQRRGRRDEVLLRLREAIAQSRDVITSLDEEAWQSLPKQPVFEGESRGDHILRAVEHFGYHTGQIALQTRIHQLLGGAGVEVGS